ncbi:FAD-dependent oxidoreductase [Staphylococcus capitis]|uniref:FAD-dependent oxidoreductase n=1 Tax=Staphylococcus capitis TaxID=29388 RepID=UPI0011A0E987|nr:FAD-dependent oxidoreductase [Staphylococcus capitis]
MVDRNDGKFKADGVLVGSGGKRKRDGLGVENTDVKMGEGGEVEVNSQVQSSVKHIYGGGDVKSGLELS